MATVTQPLSTQAAPGTKTYPRKQLCAYQGQGKHYFESLEHGHIFCSSKCRRRDDAQGNG